MAITEQAILKFSVQGAQQAGREVEGFQKTTTRSMTAAESSVAKSLGGIVAQYASMAVAIQQSMKVLTTGVGFNKFVENTTMSFGVMMKSADAAKKQMKDLYDFAVSSPLTFKETASSAKQLMAYGFAAKELVPTMKSLGTVAIATGHSLDDISYIYGTLKSQGRAYSRDLMQFGMRGIPIYEELAVVLGVGTDKIQKMASEGKIGFKEVEKAFQNMTTNGGRFAGTLEGYMATLTGKTAQLSDMWEKSAGKITGGIFAAMKDVVEGLTASLNDKGMQNFFADLSVDLGNLAKMLANVILFLVKITPLLSGILKLALAIAAITFLVQLPALITKAGIAMTTLANSMAISTLATNGMTAAVATLTGAMGALTGSMIAFAAANPWLLALLAIAAIGGTILTIKHIDDKNRLSEDSSVRAGQLAKDVKAGTSNNVGYDGMIPNSKSIKDVTDLASAYRLTEAEVANILISQKLLSKATWDTYLAAKALADKQGKLDAKAMGQHGASTIEQDQSTFFSGITGKDASAYMDPSEGRAGFTAKGAKAAREFIDGFAQAREANKAIWGGLYVPMGKYAEDLKKEAEALGVKLTESGQVQGGMSFMDESGFSPKVRARIAAITAELERLGAKKKELEKPVDMGTWWDPMITAAKLTVDAMDDIDVAKQQSIETGLAGAKKEYEARKTNYELELASGADKTAIQEKLNALEAVYLQYQKDITKEAEKQHKLKTYEVMSSGNPAYFDDLKAKAVSASESGDVTGQVGATAGASLQGTQAGSLMSGADPITMLVTSAMDFAKSIENVNKVLNPFTTLFEAMRSTLEPVVNGILQPFVNVIEMFGKAIAVIITPILQIMKILTSLWYIMNIGLLIPLQLLGNALTWMMDTVIVPLGNVVIDIINSIINAINSALGYFGVHIQTLGRLQTTMEQLNAALQADALIATMQYAANKLNGLIDDQVKSLQDLYEVGAITGAQYETQSMDLEAKKVDLDKQMVDATVSNMNTVAALSKWIQDNMGAYLKAKDNATSGTTLTGGEARAAGTSITGNDYGDAALTGAAIGTLIAPGVGTVVGGIVGVAAQGLSDLGAALGIPNLLPAWPFAEGSANIDSTGPAILHKGEGVVPATFMDGIRSGEISLSGGKNKGNGSGVTVVVNVNGSVTTEKDLAKSIANEIYTQRSRGILTV